MPVFKGRDMTNLGIGTFWGQEISEKNGKKLEKFVKFRKKVKKMEKIWAPKKRQINAGIT